MPRQLPSAVTHFTGQEDARRALDALLPEPGRRSGPVVVAAIVGPPGVGKTALAVHWAHSVIDQFPDGQLHVDLRGYHPDEPMRPDCVLEAFVRALGCRPADIPNDLDGRSALYRSTLSGRRLLILLDNARTVEQIRPLLPATPTCMVLVTSRDSLAGLVARDGAHRLGLDCLPEPDAIRLLTSVLGTDRVAAEPRAAAGLAELGGRLPLALRVIAERAARRRDTGIGELAAELARHARRLDVLVTPGDPAATVRSIFSWSYQHLPPPEARMFRLLGLHPGLDISLPAAARLAGLPADQARAALDALIRANLLAEPVPDRFALHDLLRHYAAERARDEDSEAERQSARQRYYDHYIARGRRLTALLFPGQDEWFTDIPASTPGPDTEFADAARASAWLDAERRTILDAFRQAAALPGRGAAAAVHIAAVMTAPFDVRGYWHDRVELNRVAAAVAHRLDDPWAEARARMFLGNAHGRIGRLAEEADHIGQSLALFRAIDSKLGESGALHALGAAHIRQKRYGQAVDCIERGLAIRRDLRDRQGEVLLLANLGVAHRLLGKFADAIDAFQQTLALADALDNRRMQGYAHAELAHVHRLAGRHHEAIDHYQRGLVAYAGAGARYEEAQRLWEFGTLFHELDRIDEARTLTDKALSILNDLELLTAHEFDTLRSSPFSVTPRTILLNQ